MKNEEGRVKNKEGREEGRVKDKERNVWGGAQQSRTTSEGCSDAVRLYRHGGGAVMGGKEEG